MAAEPTSPTTPSPTGAPVKHDAAAPDAAAKPNDTAASKEKSGDKTGKNGEIAAGKIGDATNGFFAGIKKAFDEFGDDVKKNNFFPAIGNLFKKMGTGGLVGGLLGGVGAMFIASIFGGGMIGMIAGILMVPLGIMLGSQQGQGPIVVSLRSIRLERDRAIKMDQRLVQPSQAAQRHAQVAFSRRMLGIGGDSFADHAHGFGQIALLHADNAKEVQGIRMARLLGQDGAVEGDGGVELALAVKAHRLLKLTGNGRRVG